jgi:hypothetical protein
MVRFLAKHWISMKKHKFKIGIGISKGNFYKLCDPKHIFIQTTQFQTFTQTAKIIRRPQLQKILSYGRQIFSNETISEPP